jgi:hypothetical protein
VFCQLLSTRIGGWICEVDATLGELVVNRLSLVPGAHQGHVTAAAGNQFTGRLDDPLVMPLGKHDPTANGRGSGPEPFEKLHSSSPAAIVTQ